MILPEKSDWSILLSCDRENGSLSLCTCEVGVHEYAIVEITFLHVIVTVTETNLIRLLLD